MPKAFRVAGLLQLHLVQVEVELMATATTTGPGMSPPFLSASADNLQGLFSLLRLQGVA